MPSKSTATSSALNGLVRVALSNAPQQLDPALFKTIEAFQFGFAVYDGLVWVDQKLQPQPMLAESWTVAEDQLSWTFTLRQGVQFHHGTPFTAKDVGHTFERLLDRRVGSSLQPILNFIKQIEIVDEYTVQFQLETPNSELPLLLGSPQARIVSHEYDGTMLSSRPSGTGPFRFVEQLPRQQITFERNPTYWDKDRPSLQMLQHIYLPSEEEQISALLEGKVDFIPDTGAKAIATLENHPEIAIIEVPSGSYQSIVMQVTEEPFTDNRVRQALKHCVDRTQLQQVVLQGRGDQGWDHPVAPISPFWATLPVSQPNIAKAKQLLAEAGYRNGLRLELITSTARPGMMELAMAFREMTMPAGIDIEVIQVPADVYWSEYWMKTPFHTGNWGFRPSIDETFMIAYHSQSKGNESRWRSPELDALIDHGRQETDTDKRKVFYQQAQALLMEEGGVIIPYFRPVLMAIRKSVQGFQTHPAGWLDMRDVKIVEADRQF